MTRVCGCEIESRSIQKTPRMFVSGDERFDFGAQGRIIRAGAREIEIPLAGWEINDGLKDLFQLPPSLGCEFPLFHFFIVING